MIKFTFWEDLFGKDVRDAVLGRVCVCVKLFVYEEK